MIPGNAMRYFSVSAQCGSFRAASEQLHVATSAISRQIKLLEDELGEPLFERSAGRKQLRLTAAGELLMNYIRNDESEMRRMRSDIDALKGMRRGKINFGVPASFVRDFLPETLAAFQQQYPNITYNIQVSGTPKLLEMLARDELDFALSFNPQPMSDIKHIYEMLLPTCVLAHVTHPLASKKSVRLSDCAEYDIALPDSSVSAKIVYDQMFSDSRIEPRTNLTSNSYELLRSMAIQGLSIAIVNSHISHSSSSKTQYRYIPFDDPRVKPQRLTCCIRRGRNLSVTALTLIEFFKKSLFQLENNK